MYCIIRYSRYSFDFISTPLRLPSIANELNVIAWNPDAVEHDHDIALREHLKEEDEAEWNQVEFA